MSKKMLLGAAIVLILGAAVAYAVMRPSLPIVPAAVVNQPQEIVLGFNAALTKNAVAGYGVAARLGFEVAVNEINAAGGILGKKIRPVILDDEGDKEISKKNVERLVNQEKASAIIGPANSGNALYWMDIPQDNEVIVITPIATATEITTRYQQRPRNYIFRISSIDKEQARLLTAWAIKKTDNGKIAILYDSTPYGLQGEKDFTEVLARWGKAPVLSKKFEKTATDKELTGLLVDAQKAGADAVLVYSLVDSSSRFVKLAAQKNYKPMLLGTAANAIDLWAATGPASSKMFYSAIIVDESKPEAISLEKKATALFGKPSPALTVTSFSYDAVYLIKAAMEKAGTTDKKAVRDALEEIDNVQGSLHVYKKPFSHDDHEGMSAVDFSVAHWVDGKRVLLGDETRDIEIR
ncbi:MAG: hypothetical protein RLZZ324_622 [Candidatus Parcubacteria bacterium]|jgi:branched-chain amino acid transport system substrate-binding protein